MHPLNTEVVDYLTQRTESMMALFYLLTLYASVRGAQWRPDRSLASAGRRVVRRGDGLQAVDGDGAADGVPDRSAVRLRFVSTRLARAWTSLRGPGSRVVAPCVPAVERPQFPFRWILNRRELVDLLAQSGAHGGPLSATRGLARVACPAVRLAAELVLTDVLPSALFIVTLLTLTAVGLRSRPRLAFLAVWVWITLAPTSTIIPIATEVGAEKRMYLPLAGLVLLAVLGVHRLRDVLSARLPPTRRNARLVSAGATILLVAVSAALGSATILRNTGTRRRWQWREPSSNAIQLRSRITCWRIPF